MGTRCLTNVKERWEPEEDWQTLATIYRHWDGYPNGQGKTLLEFLDGLALVNGIGTNMPPRYANGADQLAALLVCHMQAAGVDPCLMPADSVVGQEWVYNVLCDMRKMSIEVEVYSGPVTAFGLGGEECNRCEFHGTVEEFKVWLKRVEVAVATA